MTLLPRYIPFNGSVPNQDSDGATVPLGSGFVRHDRSQSFDSAMNDHSTSSSAAAAVARVSSEATPPLLRPEPHVNALELQVQGLTLEQRPPPPELPVISTPQHPSYRSQTPTSVIVPGAPPTFSFDDEVEKLPSNINHSALVRNAPLLPESPDLNLPAGAAESMSARATAGPTNFLHRYLHPHFSPVRSRGYGQITANHLAASNHDPLPQLPGQDQLLWSNSSVAMEEDENNQDYEPMSPSFASPPPPSPASLGAVAPPPMPLFASPEDYERCRTSPPLAAARSLKMRRVESAASFFA